MAARLGRKMYHRLFDFHLFGRRFSVDRLCFEEAKFETLLNLSGLPVLGFLALFQVLSNPFLK